MGYSSKVLPIALSSIDSATFTGSYQLLSVAAGLPNPCVMLHIVNDANVAITISYDGTTDHDYLLAATDRVLNFPNAGNPVSFGSSLAAGTKIYVKGAAGVGLVRLSGFYIKQV